MNRKNAVRVQRGRFRAAMLLLLLCGAASAARGVDVRFQNGVAPTPEYGGCVDTQISIHKGEGTGVAGAGKAPVLRTFGDRRRMLVRFDPSAREPWRMDFTEEGLKNSGYTLRNYLTLRMYADIVHKILLPAREPGEQEKGGK